MTPRTKLTVACAALTALVLLGGLQSGVSAASLARLLLGLSAIAALVLWYRKARGAGPSFKDTPRLAVVQRAGLSPRAGVALVEVDGRPFLIVHGDGFARVRAVPKRVRLTLPTHPSLEELAQ